MLIKSVSELENYVKILEELDGNETIFLNSNGKNEYVIMNISEYEKYKEDSESIELLAKLQKSELSLEQFDPIPYSNAIERIKSRY